MQKKWKVLSVVLTVSFFLCPSQASAEEPEFVPIFDGKTLNGWKGDPNYWRVEDGVLIGEVTPETILEKNSWLIWQGGDVADFELKVEYRVTEEGNSGIGYRCDMVPGEPHAMRGYQADIDGRNQYTAINYEERGRKLLAHRGMKTVIEPNEYAKVVTVFSTPEETKNHIKNGAWNAYHLYVRGGLFQHFINGVLMSEVHDKDLANGSRKGLLGVQVHVGPPMKIEYRNMRLKQYPVSDMAASQPDMTQKRSLDHRESFQKLMDEMQEHLVTK